MTISVDPNTIISPISPDFIGLGFESSSVAQSNFFTGKNAKMIRLYRNLSPNGLMRIGGNVSDHTLYEPDGISAPRPQSEVTIINHKNLLDLADFAKATGWKIMWGLNAQTDSVDDGIAEAKAVQVALGKQLHSFQIGNEVDYHGAYHGDFNQYYTFFSGYKTALRTAIPNVPISGPDSSGNTDWVKDFASREGTDAKLLTDHYYRSDQGNPDATMQNLLGHEQRLDDITHTLQAISNSSGVPYRINEINSFSGGGKTGISDTFGSALWVLDLMYKLASNGCNGVNMQTDINHLGWISHYSPIVHDPSGDCDVRPEYYGMLAFSMSGKGDIVSCTSNQGDINLDTFATKQSRGQVWLTVINKDFLRDADATITLPEGFGNATVYRLTAPAVESTDNVTLAGAQVDSTGHWLPSSHENVNSQNGTIHISVPHASAALVKLSH